MLGPDEAESEAEAEAGSGGGFVQVYVECGVRGQQVRKHFSRRAPEKGFTAEVMRGWRREASEVLAGVVASLLGDDRAAAGNGPGAGKPLEDQLRALEDRVREMEEELREAREVAEELRARLVQAEEDFQGAGMEDASGDAAKGGWETTEELRGTLRELFDKMDLNKDGAVDAGERAKTSGLLNSMYMEFGLRTDMVFEGALTYEAFEARHVREWEVTRKEQALAGVNVLRAVAEQLPGAGDASFAPGGDERGGASWILQEERGSGGGGSAEAAPRDPSGGEEAGRWEQDRRTGELEICAGRGGSEGSEVRKDGGLHDRAGWEDWAA